MAKDNLFLGMGRGSVGSVTFSRVNGQQIARARNRSPRNPQTPAQMIQRIVMSTVGKAYAFMSPICDHSFEGFETGQMSQRKFMEVNIALLRDKLADLIAFPNEAAAKASTAYNFSFKNDFLPVVNRYMISGGSLPSVPLIRTSAAQGFPDGYTACIPMELGEKTSADLTYQDVLTLGGFQRGDQLTFVQATHDGSASGHDKDLMTGFRFARIILEPANGDLTTLFLDGNNGVNQPNERNSGEFSSLTLNKTEAVTGLVFRLALVDTSVSSDKQQSASAVILSRLVNGKWLRSQQFLELRYMSGEGLLDNSTFGLAYDSYSLTPSSDLYLNQAE